MSADWSSKTGNVAAARAKWSRGRGAFGSKVLNALQRRATRSVVMNLARPFKAGIKPQTFARRVSDAMKPRTRAFSIVATRRTIVVTPATRV
jgi:hypothetical protein